MPAHPESPPPPEAPPSADALPRDAPRAAWSATLQRVWRTAGAGILVWTVVAGWPHLLGAFEAIGAADTGRLAVALAAQLGAVVLLSLTYRASLATVGARLGVLEAGGVALRAATVSRLLPGGGAAGVVFAVQRLRARGVPDGPASAGVTLNGVVTMGVLALIVAVATASSAGQARWFALAAAVVLPPVVLRRRLPRRRLVPVADRLRRWRSLALVGSAIETFATGPFHPRSFLLAAATAGGAWVLELVALWSAVAAVGHVLTPASVVLGLGAAHAAASVPHTPGGVGVVEAAMTAAYVAAGLEAEVALAGVLAYRLVGFWLPVAIGGGLFGADLRRRRARVGAVGAVTA